MGTQQNYGINNQVLVKYLYVGRNARYSMHKPEDRTTFLLKTLKPQTIYYISNQMHAIDQNIYGRLIKIHNIDSAENSSDDTYTQRYLQSLVNTSEELLRKSV